MPDQVFAERMLGPGLALEPPVRAQVDVLSPVDGTLASLHPHAFVLAVDDGRGVLVHLGLDTVELAGAGFAALRAVGDEVRTGDLLLRWDPVAVAAAGHSLLCPVVALQAGDGVQLLVAPGEQVAQGQAVLLWP